MTPKERAVKVLKNVYGCNSRTFKCPGCIKEVVDALTEAEADKEDECVKRAISWLNAYLKHHLPTSKVPLKYRALEAAIRKLPAESLEAAIRRPPAKLKKEIS